MTVKASVLCGCVALHAGHTTHPVAPPNSEQPCLCLFLVLTSCGCVSRREKEAARALAAQERLTTRRARGGDAAGPPDDEDLEYRRILQVG